jgi:hypothetical protein
VPGMIIGDSVLFCRDVGRETPNAAAATAFSHQPRLFSVDEVGPT